MDVEFEPIIFQIKKPDTVIKNQTREKNIFIDSPPKGLEKEYNELFTNDAMKFMVDLVLRFETEIELLYSQRLRNKSKLRNSSTMPRFSETMCRLDKNWKVAPVGERLQNRHLDLGDVSPSDLGHFIAALRAPVQGIQVDFDDGHCPTWRNQILGLHNVGLAVRGHLPNVPKIAKVPVLMLRPRANSN